MGTNIYGNRIDYLDTLKGIAIILVLMGHIIQYIFWNSSANFFSDDIFKYIYGFHMPLFMLICGFLTNLSLKKHLKYSEFIKKELPLFLHQ